MASSFDIVSEINLQEVDNAVNQAAKEIGQRYDFKGSKSSISLSGKENTLVSHRTKPRQEFTLSADPV